MIWVTSDLHLGDPTALTMNNRPFADVAEMDEKLIENYNRLVGIWDTVYILGDIAWRSATKVQAMHSILSLHGNKILIRGNHDKRYQYDGFLFEDICDYKKLRYQHCKFIMMHYLLQEWDGADHFSIHLHGHIHSKGLYNETNIKNGIRKYDVGVDANHFCPVNLDELVERFKNAPYIKRSDRHNYDETVGQMVVNK